jgi:two-component system cell cycle response regulator
MKARAEREQRSGTQLLRLFLAVVIGAGTLFVALHDWLGLGPPSLDYAAEGPVYDAVIVAAGLTCLLRSLSVREERGAWIAIGLGILAWAAAEVYWTTTILNDPSPPYPSPADVGYLLFYPLAGIGLGLLVRARAGALDWRLWMDGAIATLGTAALGTAFVFDFVVTQTEGTALQVATTLAYPLGDIVLFSCVVGVTALTRWRPGRAWSLLLVGLAALAVADVAYTLQETDLGLAEGPWVDPIYLIAATCLGAQAWQSRTRNLETSSDPVGGWRELMVPAVFAAVMVGLFGMQYLSSATGLSTILWAATMVAVIVRLALSDRENKALLAQVRTDPLTGLLSRGALQIDLDGLCAKATDEEPVTVLLFDLDGFKSYNDTCGHPAGDELLAELGGRLRATVGDDGFAYRVGGDEFCVVLTSIDKSVDELTREAAIALSTRKNGVDVSASWGSATIPAAAEGPREAMQLADVRMYAQKESRRASRGRERDPMVVPLEPPTPEPDLERRGAPQEPGSVEA